MSGDETPDAPDTGADAEQPPEDSGAADPAAETVPFMGKPVTASDVLGPAVTAGDDAVDTGVETVDLGEMMTSAPAQTEAEVDSEAETLDVGHMSADQLVHGDASSTAPTETVAVSEDIDQLVAAEGPHPNPAHANLRFSEAAAARVEWLRTRYPKDHQRALILPVLSMAQREFGWVSEQVIHYVAAQIPVPPMWVEQVATFYTMYNKQPIGRWHLQVCQNISCALMGAEIVIEHIEKALDISCGETTADGEFTLIGAECLGSCGTAPMMQVNDHYHESLSLQDVDDLLGKLRATPDQPADPKDLPFGPGSGPSRALPREAQGLVAGQGIIIPHPGEHHGPDPKARPPVGERAHAQDPDAKPGYAPQGMAR